ncbi:hypothetical protein [Dactylosporangium sp. NPDC051541]|uniref:hypothetical protein n=1 Tax=Dactylosporangium sp. NPDC051541 TaxID=3363977 RepID=UPI00378B29BF
MRTRWSVAALGLVLVAAAGCGVPPSAAAAAAEAVALLRAHQRGDGQAMCALLAPDTAAELARSSGTNCADAVGDEDLPDPGAVTDVTVDGQWAKVVIAAADDDGTVFLATFPGGWRVVAAGCRSRGERPYDCTVNGG